jgi:SAM-dependent methyltransferase
MLLRIARTTLALARRTLLPAVPTRPVTGSHPPLGAWDAVGPPANFYIHDGYAARSETAYYDDTPATDGWQREVYQYARELADREGLARIADVGCGSGFKLLKHFADRETVGFDVAPTVSKLRARHPERRWEVTDFGAVPPGVRPDLVICSDVIEHLQDPDLLLGFVERLAPAWIVLSTPDRNLLRLGTHDGPPLNRTHVREWNMAEFRAYIGSRFQVVEHFVSNAAQCTQLIVARPPAGRPAT